MVPNNPVKATCLFHCTSSFLITMSQSAAIFEPAQTIIAVAVPETSNPTSIVKNRRSIYPVIEGQKYGFPKKLSKSSSFILFISFAFSFIFFLIQTSDSLVIHCPIANETNNPNAHHRRNIYDLLFWN